MRIGILVSMINNFGEKGFYNSQEIGMGKALAQRGHKVKVFKLLKEGTEKPQNETINGVEISYETVKSVGINGLVDTKILDKDMDSLLYFSDTQLSVPKVYRWCKRNHVVFIPYIGVLESHSPNKFKARIMNILFKRNVWIFKKTTCLAKNVDVQSRLRTMGVDNVLFAPVGIDLDLVNKKYKDVDSVKLRETFGFRQSDKIVLYIGRLEEEKRPVELVELFAQLYELDNAYRLIIVGKGYLYQEVMDRIAMLKIGHMVTYIEKIPNDQIWQLYRLADAFVNLNKQEIFGMVLMEAMYYESKLVAFHAPGPDYIVDDGITGFLVNTNEEMIDAIRSTSQRMGELAHERVIKHLTWEKTVSLIEAVSNNHVG